MYSSIFVASLAMAKLVAGEGTTGGASSTTPTTPSAAAPTTPAAAVLAALLRAKAKMLNQDFYNYLFIVLASLIVSMVIWRVGFETAKYVRTMVSLNNDTQRYFATPSSGFAKFKKHVLYAPIFGKRHNREIQMGRAINVGTLPTRLQFVFLLAYFSTNVAFCVVSINWDQSYATVAQEIRNRTGVLAVVNMIPLFIMAARNNPLINWLNMSFDTFNLLHRWTGRVVTLQMITHVAAWAASKVHTSSWATVWKALGGSLMLLYGLIGVIAAVLIMIQASSPIRHAAYETFKYLHIALVIVVIIGIYYHLKLANLPQLPLLWGAIILWASERATRVLKVAYRNFGKGGSRTLVEALPGNAVRVTLDMARPWKFKPGQHAYLYMPSIGLFQSHPFSVAWSEESEDLSEEKLAMNHQDILAMRKTTMSFVIRARTGFTEKLFKKAEASPNGEFPTSYNQPPVYSNGNCSQVSTSVSQQAQSQASPSPQKTEEYKAQLRDLGRDAKAIWNSMNGVKEVPGSVKVYTIIYHILKRFRSKFQQDPPLSMIVDGLSNNKDMRPVRNINGLLCRACVLGMAGSVTSFKSDKKHFSFPQLAIHFRTVHEEGVPSNLIGHFPDWSKDMVELPDQAKMSSVSTAPGMDDQKLAIFSEALLEIVAIPPPRKDTTTQKTPSWQPKVEALDQGAKPWQQIPYASHGMTENLAPSQDNHGKYYGTVTDACTPGTEPISATSSSDTYGLHNPRDTRERQASRKPTSLTSSSRHNKGRQVFHDKSVDRHRSVKPSSPLLSYATPEKDYGPHTVHDDTPVYSDRNIRYRELHQPENRPRYERTIRTYDDLTTPVREYAAINSQPHKSNQQEEQFPAISDISKDSLKAQYRPLEDATSQQNRIFEVVAQISQQAQQARGMQAVVREGAARITSEDEELQRDIVGQNNRKRSSDEATNDAERFLNNFQPDRRSEVGIQRVEQTPRRRDDVIEPKWETEHSENMRHRRPLSSASQNRLRDTYNDDFAATGRPTYVSEEQAAHGGYYIQERPFQGRQIRAYATENHYVDPIHGKAFTRERSPETIDRRHASNVIYRDERQGSHGAHRTPSRYARYESVRLENDRARSRSPVYVKVGAQPGQYTERSPDIHPPHQEPTYRTRTPKEEIIYERAPRQEYYRVYADEQRPRQAYEYVQYDAQGPYVIHRPVRREPEAIYAAYEDESYSRQPLYETRAAVARTDPAYYEEYDPRHPEPPTVTTAREVRYQ